MDTFPNPNPGSDYLIQHIAEEFTSICPVTSHPDFGTVVLTYVADAICVELKSYKLYLHAYRNEGIYFEAVTNRIYQDMVELLKPRWLRIETIWKGRGGIRSNVCVETPAGEYAGTVPPFFS
ncbi:MAG: preQ(1) synthase [Verrucomicrobiota bacterium]